MNHPTAGEYRAIGLDLQGANPEEAARLQAEVEATQAVLDSGDQSGISVVSRGRVVGDFLYSVIYSYLALNDVQDQVEARAAGIVNYRLPSFGLFSTMLQTSYFFGVPRNVNFGGLSIDVDRLAIQGTAKDNDNQKSINYILAAGNRASAMEHIVPEIAFSSEQSVAEGMSAVKALAIASAEGQRIWTIDQNNLSEALSAINLGSEIENEIRNAVLAGMVATAHEEPISFIGATNADYLLRDLETGAGAYLISSGANGGEVVIEVVQRLLSFLGLSVNVGSVINGLTSGPFGAFLEGLGSALTFLTFIVGIINISGNPSCSTGAARYLILVHTFLSILLIGGALGAMLLVFPLLYGFFLLLAVSYAASQVVNHATNVVCDQ